MFVISTSHSGGGLPLGVLITSDEKASTLERSFACFCKILPDFAFFNQGPSNGPKIFMSDDSLSQSQAISATWSNAKQLLCVFHVLQSFWTWLHDGKNKVQAIHRQTLMLKIKDLVYAKSEQQLAERFNQILKDNTAVIYPQFIKHVNNYWPRRHKWAICFRQHLLIRGNQTNNYAETGIKILKEIVFSHVKAYNLIEMVSFVTDTMDLYYQRRLLHLANNRIDRYISLRYCGMTSCTIPKETITQDKVPNIFFVQSRQSRGDIYTVDMHLGVCTCPRGTDGSPCSHQAAISKHYHYISCNSIPTMFPTKKRELAVIALGDKAVQDLSYYTSIHQKADELSYETSEVAVTVENASDIDFSSNAWKIIQDGAADAHELIPESPKQSSSLSDDLDFVFRDLKQQVANDSGGQLCTGVMKFCERYKKFAKQRFAHNALASAFHKFGWVFGGTVSRQAGALRHGRRIAVQATAAGRRRKTLSRGKAKAQAGRPVKCESTVKRTKSKTFSRYHLPIRKVKPSKRHHSLSKNIQLCQQNAGKW